MKKLPEWTRAQAISGDVIVPLEARKAYVEASHAYHTDETPEHALALLRARARVLREEPFSITAQVIRSEPRVDKALAIKAGIPFESSD